MADGSLDNIDALYQIRLAEALKLKAWRRWSFLWAQLGVLAIGITLPVLLVSIHARGRPMDLIVHDSEEPLPERNLSYVVSNVLELEFAALLFTSPGAAILTGILWVLLQGYLDRRKPAQGQLIRVAAIVGVFMAFMNIPAYFCFMLLESLPGNVHLKTALLFAISGASSGAWIGWQVWQSRHLDAPWFPRFSLTTLLLVVFGWAVLLFVFAPVR